MGNTVTLRLDADTDAQLRELSKVLGFSKEYAAIYAVRLISACMREGLLRGELADAWPKEAQLLTASGGRVLAFERTARDTHSRA